MGGYNIPANIDLDIVQSPLGYTSCFLNFAFGVVCDARFIFSDPLSTFYSVYFRSLFSRANIILSADHTPLKMEWY
jgi:hypothetical protein